MDIVTRGKDQERDRDIGGLMVVLEGGTCASGCLKRE